MGLFFQCIFVFSKICTNICVSKKSLISDPLINMLANYGLEKKSYRQSKTFTSLGITGKCKSIVIIKWRSQDGQNPQPLLKLGTILLQCQQIKRCLKTSTAFISVHIKLSHIPINVGNVHVNIQIKNKRQGPTILFIKFHRRVADTRIVWSIYYVFLVL